MIATIQKRTNIGKVMALGFLLATLLMAIALSAAPPAGAAAPSGKAFGWGYNNNGELGNGTSGNETNTPGAVSNLTGVKSVKAGCNHSLALKQDGTVYAWGYGISGALGNGSFDSSDVPVQVKIDNVKAISAGCGHSLALKENGSVWAWGGNVYGQLGNGTEGAATSTNVPVKVATLGTGANAIAASRVSSFALMKNGAVKSWGDNSFGQLGNGASGFGTNETKPVTVANLSGVKAIATDNAAYHALALLEDGTVKSWGFNSAGQLGNGASGPNNKRTKPVRVANLSGVEAIATGENHSLALLGSGKVKSWGANNNGQLGNGASANRSTPGNVIGLENVRSISGGAEHSLAVLVSGKVRSWGSNSSGQLGNGTSEANSNIPVAVKNLTNVTNIDGGHEFTLAATQ